MTPHYQRCTLTVPAAGYDAAVDALLTAAPMGWEEEPDVRPGDGDPRVGRSADASAERRLTFWIRDDLPCVRTATALAGLRELGRLEFVEQEDGWLDAWKDFHKPTTVAGVTVRPPWSEPVAGTLDVVIEVSMAFGTGSHATTRGCLAALVELADEAAAAGRAPGSLFDIGTGSGVLALAALRLGFAPVLACDNDPEALAQARDNAARNGLALEPFEADCTDSRVGLPAADTVVANILLAPLQLLGARYAALPEAQAPRVVVLSGLLDEQAAAAEAAFRGFRRRRTIPADGWATLILER